MQQANRKKRHHQLRSKNFSKAKTNKAPSKVASGLGGISRCAGSMPMQLKGPAVSLIVVAKKKKKNNQTSVRFQPPTALPPTSSLPCPSPNPPSVSVSVSLSLSLCLSLYSGHSWVWVWPI